MEEWEGVSESETGVSVHRPSERELSLSCFRQRAGTLAERLRLLADGVTCSFPDP